MRTVDVRGLMCPEPVVRVQKAIQSNPEGVIALADAAAPVENLKRFAAARGYKVDVRQDGAEYELTLRKE